MYTIKTCSSHFGTYLIIFFNEETFFSFSHKKQKFFYLLLITLLGCIAFSLFILIELSPITNFSSFSQFSQFSKKQNILETIYNNELLDFDYIETIRTYIENEYYNLNISSIETFSLFLQLSLLLNISFPISQNIHELAFDNAQNWHSLSNIFSKVVDPLIGAFYLTKNETFLNKAEKITKSIITITKEKPFKFSLINFKEKRVKENPFQDKAVFCSDFSEITEFALLYNLTKNEQYLRILKDNLKYITKFIKNKRKLKMFTPKFIRNLLISNIFLPNEKSIENLQNYLKINVNSFKTFLNQSNKEKNDAYLLPYLDSSLFNKNHNLYKRFMKNCTKNIFTMLEEYQFDTSILRILNNDNSFLINKNEIIEFVIDNDQLTSQQIIEFLTQFIFLDISNSFNFENKFIFNEFGYLIYATNVI